MLEASQKHGVWLAWLDAKMPTQQFEHNQGCQKRRKQIGRLLGMFDLVLPETDVVKPKL